MIQIKKKIILISVIALAMVLPNLLFCKPSNAEQAKPSFLQGDAFLALNFEKVKIRLKELKEKLEIVESMEEEAMANQLGVALTLLQDHNSNLRKMETIYQRYFTAMERRDSLNKEEKSLSNRLDSQQESLMLQLVPYNLSIYDSLLDELTTVKQQEQSIDIALKSAKEVLEEAKTKLEQARQKVREKTETLLKEGETARSLEMSRKLEFAKVEEELTRVFLNLQRITAENSKTELRLVQLKMQITQRHVDWVRSKLAFDQEDLDHQLDSLEEHRITLQTRVVSLRKEQQDIENLWSKAQKEFEAAQGADQVVKATATAFLKAREAWRETYQNVLEQAENIMLILDQEKQFWQRRYTLLENDANYEELDNWEKQTSDYMKNIEWNIKFKEKDQTNLQSEIAGIQKQLADENLNLEMNQHVETHVDALNKMMERNFEYLSLLQRTRAVGQRFLDEINLKQKDISIKTKIMGVGSQVDDLWKMELWVVDERSVTVKKIVITLFILVIGMLIARWFTHFIITRALLKMRLDESAIVAINKTLYFFVLVVLLVLALRYVNIPLTVFTFLGGAIAIGVGFGAQNLLNNFISGFILLAERPVKINDLIEVENNFGIIENIGMRCTRVRTPGNVHILVPNSSFLEKNIVNWTLSDHEIRAKVALGVADSSDPSEVSRLMLKAVHEHKKVLKKMEPVVLFDEMGDSSFNFIVYFSVSMKSLQLIEIRSIESDIRFHIVRLFREAGIEMAYPRRYVHFDTSNLLDLRLVA